MKVTKTAQTGAVSLMAGSIPAGGVIVDDTGGNFPDDNLEDILAWLAAGGLDGYLRSTLGGLDVVQPLGTLGSTETIDLVNANVFWGTLDQNCTITTVGWTNLRNATILVELIQDGTGGWLPTFTGVTWKTAAPSVAAAGEVTEVILRSRDGGTTIWGYVTGSAASSSSGGPAPTELLAGEIFTVPDRRQTLWSESIVMGVGAGIVLGPGSAFLEVH